MQEAPLPDPDPANLRFLRRLVTVLTATMIVGLVVIIALFVIRFYGGPRTPALPDTITLPDGTRPLAYTETANWYAVVTADDRILIFERGSGALMQEIQVEWSQ